MVGRVATEQTTYVLDFLSNKIPANSPMPHEGPQEMVAVGGRIWTKASIRESHRWVSALPTVLQIILVTSAGVRLQ
jgi:hypothetical protein